jgi:hypothetical protein
MMGHERDPNRFPEHRMFARAFGRWHARRVTRRYSYTRRQSAYGAPIEGVSVASPRVIEAFVVPEPHELIVVERH